MDKIKEARCAYNLVLYGCSNMHEQYAVSTRVVRTPSIWTTSKDQRRLVRQIRSLFQTRPAGVCGSLQPLAARNLPCFTCAFAHFSLVSEIATCHGKKKRDSEPCELRILKLYQLCIQFGAQTFFLLFLQIQLFEKSNCFFSAWPGYCLLLLLATWSTSRFWRPSM